MLRIDENILESNDVAINVDGVLDQDAILILKNVCDVDGVSMGELRSGSRRREIVNARGVFSWLAVKALGYSGAEAADFWVLRPHV